jgi:hypothetical protein
MRTPWMVDRVPSLVDVNLNDQIARRDRARDQCSEFRDESRNGTACSMDASWVAHLILLLYLRGRLTTGLYLKRSIPSGVGGAVS